MEKALNNIAADVEVEPAIREGIEVDRDTQGVAGWAPITDTIFNKIDDAAMFAPDLTFIGERLDRRRPTPNPNVLVECGWALKSLGYERTLPIMNVRYGRPEGDAMPFNLRHLRHPLQYELDASASDQIRRDVRNKLVGDIEHALRLMLASDAIKRLLPKSPEPEPFLAAEPRQGLSRFRAAGEPVGIIDGPINDGVPVYLTDGPAMWLRLMPLHHSGATYPATTLRELVRQSSLLPIASRHNYFSNMRSNDGFGLCAIESNDKPINSPAIVFVFESGELWSTNSGVINCTDVVPYFPEQFISHFETLASFLHDRLGLARPYRWIVGIEGIKGRPLVIGPRSVGYSRAHCVADVITQDEEYLDSQDAASTLRPFFAKILEKCSIDIANMGNLLPSG